MAQTSYPSSMDPAFAGMLADLDNKKAISMNNGEASAEMPFGVAVCWGASDDEALLPDATSDVIAGILLHAHSYDPDSQLGDDGVLPDNTISVLRKGTVWAVCEDGCSPGDRLFVRAVTSGAEQEGALRASADSTDCIDCTNQGVWLTTAAEGGLAKLEVDFTNSPTVDEAEA